MTEADAPLPEEPKRRFRLLSTQSVTAGIGILVMVLALLANHWVIRAQTVFRNFERVNFVFNDLDYADLVFMYDLCNQRNESELTTTDLSRFVQITKSVERYDALLAQTRNDAIVLANSLRIGEGARTAWRHVSGATTAVLVWVGLVDDPQNDRTSGMVSPLINQQVQMSYLTPGSSPGDPLAPARNVCDQLKGDPADLLNNFRVWRTSLQQVSWELGMNGGDLMFSGKGLGSNENLEQQLQSRMEVMTRWWLPILNGTLGAVLFCLTLMLPGGVRAVRPRPAPKLGEVLLRVVFGGFAGFVVSTLLIPSGVLALPSAGSAPGVSFLAFVFGFSLDSFVHLLARLNQVVIESVGTKKTES